LGNVKRRRILHVFQTFEVGGTQVRFAAIANHFGRRWQHVIIAMNGNLASRSLLDPELEVDFPEVVSTSRSTLGNARRFRKSLQAIKPDLMMTYSWGAIEWALANVSLPLSFSRSIRHIHLEDGFGAGEQEAQFLRRSLLRRACLRSSTVVLPSLTLYDVAVKQWRLPEKGVYHIANGVDLHRFAPAKNLLSRSELPVVGVVAALRPEKNHARLLRAFRLATMNCPARLVIVGDGIERARLEALTVELGLSGTVSFVGATQAPEHAYRELDVFALSSDTEQMPLSILEAMAAGLPVVATDVGDVRAMLSNDNQPFVASRDDHAFAASLHRLLQNPRERVQLGSANRVRAEAEYGLGRMLHNHAALIEANLF
jgi:glycosyltransferase involved in cell wall biosynthesis